MNFEFIGSASAGQGRVDLNRDGVLKRVRPIGGRVETRDEQKAASHGGKDIDVFFGWVLIVVIRWSGRLLD